MPHNTFGRTAIRISAFPIIIAIFAVSGLSTAHASPVPQNDASTTPPVVDTTPVVVPAAASTTPDAAASTTAATTATTTVDVTATTTASVATSTDPEASTTPDTTGSANAAVASFAATFSRPVSSNPLTLVASAITCASESDLPNWGNGGPSIGASTAPSYVATHPSCHLVSGWNFQWGLGFGDNSSNTAKDPGAAFVGAAGGSGLAAWHTFGPSDAAGVATADISDFQGASTIWFRENLPAGYIPFSEPVIKPVGQKNAVSAETYCADDVLNFDNYDALYSPHLSTTYYCITFNALATSTAANHAPVITLIGSSTVNVSTGQTFTDPGATATDTEDGVITSRIAVTGSVNTATPGTYTLTYNVTDSGGLAATPVTRTVIISTPACTLSVTDFHNAISHGTFNYRPMQISSDGTKVTFIVTNNTACGAQISLASYKMFVAQNGPQWLSTQVRYDSTGTTTIAASSTQTLTVMIPDCKVQVDAFYGNAPLHLLDSNPYSYPNVPYVFGWLIGPKPLCTNGGGGGTATNTPPTITLLGNNPLIITQGSAFADPGATATDTEDGNITSRIVATGTVDVNTLGSYTITYSVTDSGGLGATTTRTVTIQAANNGGGGGTATNTPPVITILGNNPETIDVNTAYTDAGATATDTEDGDLTSHIVATGTVSTTTVGTYTITYTVTDSGGLTATSTRTVNVVNPSNNGGGGGGGSNGGGPNIGIGGGYGVPLFAAAGSFGGGNLPTTGLQCPLLRDFLRIDFNNDPAEVVKLQAFLQRTEGFDVDVNGTFDQKTLAGVNAFQTKYLSQVMGPWGATRPSGYVYITTKKKINEIACDTAFIINSSEQAIIDAYKAQTAASIQNGTPATTSPDIGVANSSSSVALGNGSLDNNPNTAGAANASSILARFWNFLKNLFHING